MKGWKLTEIAGIGVFVHWSFLILPILVGYSTLSAGHGLAAAVDAVFFVLAIFGCVVLHELGHALMARRFGISTRSITLLPIGGVANLDRLPERPRDELAVALAGPAVNVAIAGAIFVTLLAAGITGFTWSANSWAGSFLVRLFWANVALVVFNLLPAFPMDGGRVLRALLAMRLSHARATQIAASVGQVMAVLFAIVGIFGQWMLVFVALFVFLAGRAEAQLAQAKESVRGWVVGDAMQREFHLLPAEATLEEAARAALFSPQSDFPIVQDDRLVGMLAKHDALQLLSQGQGCRKVSDAMRRDVPTVQRDSPLSESFDKMQQGNYHCLPVADRDHLVGMITATTLRNWITLWAGRSVAGHSVAGRSW